MNRKKEEPVRERKENNIPEKVIHPDGSVAYEGESVPLWYIKSRRIIYYVLGVKVVLLALRFLFMLLGANPRSGFTVFLYSLTGILIAPFAGIFNPVSAAGLVSRSVFDPATLIAMSIYALLDWGIVKLLWLKASRGEGNY